MPRKKSEQEKLLEAKLEEDYQLKVQELMNLIPVSNVFKKDESIKFENVVLPACRWYVGEYVVDSDFHIVHSIEADDVEEERFQLTPADYRKFVKACKARHNAMMAQRKKQK